MLRTQQGFWAKDGTPDARLRPNYGETREPKWSSICGAAITSNCNASRSPTNPVARNMVLTLVTGHPLLLANGRKWGYRRGTAKMFFLRMSMFTALHLREFMPDA